MVRVMVNLRCGFKREDEVTRRSIAENAYRLGNKIIEINKDIGRIFNMESVVYDKINSQMYLYKCHGTDNVQLRIVYAIKRSGDTVTVYIVDYYNKKKNSKRYLKEVGRRFRDTTLEDFVFYEIAV